MTSTLKWRCIKEHLGILLYVGLAFLLSSCASSPPAGLGLVDGRLASCPDKPNCVCSENSGTDAYVAPLSFGSDDRNRGWNAAQDAVKDLGGNIEKVTGDYLWATFSSKVFGFIDDFELRMVPEQEVIQVRSAARLGYSDFGVNRKRVESLRKRFGERLNQLNPP